MDVSVIRNEDRMMISKELWGNSREQESTACISYNISATKPRVSSLTYVPHADSFDRSNFCVFL
jgi:hypothetical protein